MSFEKTVLITGGTTGLGYQCALEAAKSHSNYQIVIASRTGGEAADAINRATGTKNVAFMSLDLSSTAQVRDFAQAYQKRAFPPIIALVLNAGLQITQGIKNTVDGIEMTFGINHVGHALLFYLLRSQLDAHARIVITASGTHDPAQKTSVPDATYASAERVAHVTPTADNTSAAEGRRRYSTSKLCNVLWTYGLHDRLDKANKQWTVNAFDPGLMPSTGLARDAPAFLQFIWNHILPYCHPLLRLMLRSDNIHSPAESGRALEYVALSANIAGVSGRYFEGKREIRSSIVSYDKATQDDLYDWTINFLSRNKEEASAFADFS